MDQVSRPLQILLVAVLLFGAVYMLALRPKGDSSSSTPSTPAPHAPTSPAQGPGSSIPGGLGKSVTKARGAAGQSDAANQRIQQATGGGPTSTSAAPVAPVAPVAPARSAARRTATPAGAPGRAGVGFPVNNAAASSVAVAAGMLAAGIAQAAGAKLGVAPSATVAVTSNPVRSPGPARHPVATPKATSSPAAVQTAMAGGKVVVLLFWNQQASDDRRVHEELGQVSSHGGKVLIVSAPVRQVSLFSSSIRGIQVLQSPTILVVDHSHRARTLVGYTDRAEIGQAVDDALVGR
jgi:hypothetical protein